MKTIRRTKDTKNSNKIMRHIDLSKSIIMKNRHINAEKISMMTSPICSLPNELLVEILAHVADSSISDFFRAKLSWKLFNKLAKDDNNYLHRQLSLDELSSNQWDLYLCKEATSLFTRCLESENPEALYRQGVIEYIFQWGKESDLELLKRAATMGHLKASYVLGIILICKGDEFTQNGLELISNVKTDLQKQECRKSLKILVNSLWLRQNRNFLKPKLFQCQFPHRKRSGWTLSSYNDNGDIDLQCCEACKLNQEIIYVCNKLTGVSLVSSPTCYQD